jgi:cytochrome b6-f complex iron-sulfur subunit
MKHTNPLHFSKPTRREFCVQTCQTASLVALAAMIEACGGSATSPSSVPLLPTISASVAGGAITMTVDAGSPLSAVGRAALVQTSSGNVLVARTAQDSFTALTAVCTHEACTVTGFDNQIYICPCHGSQYSTNGAVVKGPAPAALRQFPTRFANNVLTITIA